MAPSADRSILELARRRRGLVTISQHRDVGISPDHATVILAPLTSRSCG